MYCETCGVDASYCPPQPDGSYLCPGCAGIGEDTQPARPEPAPEPDTGGVFAGFVAKSRHSALRNTTGELMGGRSGSGASKSTSVQRIISAAGGVRAAGNLLRAGDKIAGRLEAASAAFRGASRAQANAIATGKANAISNTAHGASVARSQRLPPISVHVSTAGGKTRLTVTDGRHRTAAALSAGATRIRAKVTYEHRGKNGRVYERSAGVQIVKL